MANRIHATFLLLFFTQAVFSQTTAPATMPSAAIDQTTPRGSLKVFFHANARSDGQALRNLMLASNPAEQAIIDALADQKDVDRLLSHALRTKFPDPSMPDPEVMAEQRLSPIDAKIDQSDEQITGDAAILKAPGPDGQPFAMKRVDGKWRIPVAVLVASTSPDVLERQAHQIEIQVAVMRTAAADVTAGKYASASDAIADVKQRMYTAALADHAAATQSATQP